MRRLTYSEIVELAKHNKKEAIFEAKINYNLAKEDDKGMWAGLIVELQET